MLKKILIVMTNTATYEGTTQATGLWLNEATEFITPLLANNYIIDYVSPRGGYVPLDPRSMKHLSPQTVEIYKNESFQQQGLANSKNPEEINPTDYLSMYFTGGHGVMWDFPNNKRLQEISLAIYHQGGYLCSVCHGIAGLLNIKNEDNTYLIKGKKITGFTTTEEYLSGKKHLVPFMNEKWLKNMEQFLKKLELLNPL